MAFSSFPPLLNTIVAISITLISTIIFSKPQLYPTPSPQIPHRSLLSQNQDQNFTLSCTTLPSSNGLIDYLSLHFCLFKENFLLSIPCLTLFVLLHFYVLIETAQSHFSIVTTKLTHRLNLSPSMGGVTLLALGNGAPDVFASLAAVRSGQYRTGFGAILSAGTFVSAFVVGFVAIYAAPFNVDPASFIRDVGFYLLGALILFYVYLSGEIFFWQAVGFVGFYLFFVGFVFWMDLGSGGIAAAGGAGGDDDGKDGREMDCERGGKVVVGSLAGEKEHSGCFERAYGMVMPCYLACVFPFFLLSVGLSCFWIKWNVVCAVLTVISLRS